MNICENNEFTFISVPEDFSVFCRAELPECGSVFMLPAPRLECGMLLSVRPDGSIAYTVSGESSLSFTVSAFPLARVGITPRVPVKLHRRIPVQHFSPLAFRKSTFLRL